MARRASADPWSDKRILSNYVTLRWVAGPLPWLRAIVFVGVTEIVPFLGCWLDGCLKLPEPGWGMWQDPVFLWDLLGRVLVLGFAVRAVQTYSETFRPVRKDDPAPQSLYHRIRRDVAEFHSGEDRFNASLGPLSLRTRRSIRWHRLLIVVGLLAHVGYLIESRLYPPVPERWTALRWDHPWALVGAECHLLVLWLLIAPEVSLALLALVHCTTRNVRVLASEKALLVSPLAPDGCAGLSQLGRLTVAMNMTLVGGLPLLIALLSYARWTVMDVVALVFVILAMFVCTFFPLWSSHGLMRDTRSKALQQIAARFEHWYSVWERIPEADGRGLRETASVLSSLKQVWRTTTAMQVWPLDFRSIRRFAVSAVLPALVLVVRFAWGWKWFDDVAKVMSKALRVSP